jgi:small subunit ribosomal protein S20
MARLEWVRRDSAPFSFHRYSIHEQGSHKMANTPQAKKRIRRNARRADINGARVSRIRTFVKQVEAALAAGNKAEAEAAIRKVQPELMRGVSKGVVHKNTASRKISRLTKRISALA